MNPTNQTIFVLVAVTGVEDETCAENAIENLTNNEQNFYTVTSKIIDDDIITSQIETSSVKNQLYKLINEFEELTDNLSMDGSCWVSDNARVYGEAQVDAWVSGEAQVSVDARVYGEAQVDARVYGEAQVDRSRIAKNGTCKSP